MIMEGSEEVAGGPWSRKRRLQAKMERMRQAKQSKSSCAVEPASPVHSESEAGPSTQPSSQEETGTLEESFSVQLDAHSESESLSSSDDDSESFTREHARRIYSNWVEKQSKDSIKILAVMLMDTLMDRFGMTAVGAANEAGLVLGVNEKTVRKWRRDFYTNDTLALTVTIHFPDLNEP